MYCFSWTSPCVHIYAQWPQCTSSVMPPSIKYFKVGYNGITQYDNPTVVHWGVPPALGRTPYATAYAPLALRGTRYTAAYHPLALRYDLSPPAVRRTLPILHCGVPSSCTAAYPPTLAPRPTPLLHYDVFWLFCSNALFCAPPPPPKCRGYSTSRYTFYLFISFLSILPAQIQLLIDEL